MRVPASLRWVLRLGGAVLLGSVGWTIASLLPLASLPAPLSTPFVLHSALTVVLAILGWLAVPWLFLPPLSALVERLSQLSVSQIIADFIGVVTGLIVGALVAVPLSFMPDPFRQVLPIVSAVIFANIGFLVMNARYREIFSALNIRFRTPARAALEDEVSQETPALPAPARDGILLDSSAIIDGRVADICQTGFVRGELIVPRFVLNEVQRIADSPDAIRRARGRRGLEVLKRLQKESLAPVRFSDDDAPPREVDEKLVVLAKRTGWPVVTNDFNLNKVASLQGVRVLNINELANAVKSVLLPGETLNIKIIQRGKDPKQGVGYLDDGTMVVVEDGADFLDETIDVVVSKVLQTAAGRMIFAKP
ncbi:MAG: TRAM domain-containing protein [Thermoflexales bacterium]|nr:TRAM domain-containing protein [Thermoflexales bacterium]